MKKEITWTAGTGQKVVVEIELQTSETLVADQSMSKPCCNITYRVYVDGVKGNRENLNTVDGHPVVVARLGNIGIKAENYIKILAATAEIKQCEYYVAWQAKLAEAEKIDREFSAHNARVNKMMNP